MKTPVDELLRAQARTYALRFACDDCAHFDREAAAGACSLGYPASPRRPEDGSPDPLFGHLRALEFCKSFELG
jgi:hypothetical protein